MTHNQIFAKTMPFVWLKLLLGLITLGLSIALFALMAFFVWLLQGIGWPFFFVFWLVGTTGIHFVVVRYLGYLVRAGHVAVVAEAVTTGKIPEKQVAYGKNMVKERFLASNAFFAISKLVDRSVKQLQGTFERVSGFIFGAIPGANLFLSFVKFFIGVSLKYVDDCCLGWVFHNKEQGAVKSALDGVVIYAQNWKVVLKSALKTSFMVILISAVLIALSFFLLRWLLGFIGDGGFGFSLWGIVAFFLAIFIAITFKRAFIDSYMMVRMMTSYMQIAPSTQITFDLYDKLSKVSKSFKALFDKAEAEGPVQAPALAALPPATNAETETETEASAPPPTQQKSEEDAPPLSPLRAALQSAVASLRPTPVPPPAPPPPPPTQQAEEAERPVRVSLQQARPRPTVVSAVSVRPAPAAQRDPSQVRATVAVRPRVVKPAQTISCPCGHISKSRTPLCNRCGGQLD